MVLVRKQTLLIEQPPLVSKVSATFVDSGCYVVTQPYSRISRL
jgi:hypothetical protein